MASSDNLEPWISRPIALPDAWISEAYARDADALTKALQMSLSKNTDTYVTCDDNINNNNNNNNNSNFASSSFVETTALPKHQLSEVIGGKVTKRKSRASKKGSQITYITADVANFRHMVQQVTGVRFGDSQVPPVPLLKPEPQRPGYRSSGPAGCLPTLDTSAFLLDHQHQHHLLLQRQVVIGPDHPVSIPQPDGPHSGLDYDAFSSAFPTLEGWKGV